MSFLNGPRSWMELALLQCLRAVSQLSWTISRCLTSPSQPHQLLTRQGRKFRAENAESFFWV